MEFNSDNDIDIDDRECPKCGYHTTYLRICEALYCDDGWIDEAEEDEINYAPGQEFYKCPECNGTGVQWWCSKCGANLSYADVSSAHGN